jgi:hypothetical protein
MATKQMNVSSDGFNPNDLTVNKNQDSVHFVQSGQGAPTEVTISSSTLFGVTTCTVDASTTGPNVYTVQPNASGSYTAEFSEGTKRTIKTGTIQVGN